MGHRGGWGTRANAYTADVPDADLRDLALAGDGSVPAPRSAPPESGDASPRGGSVAVAERVAAPATVRARRVRRPNLEGLLPYAIGLAVVVLEVLYRG
jgi:hypothetical protein